MKPLCLAAFILAGSFYCTACQVTVEDFRPAHLRQGGGESPEAVKPEPVMPEVVKPEPEKPVPAGKDVIYAIGLKGID